MPQGTQASAAVTILVVDVTVIPAMQRETHK